MSMYKCVHAPDTHVEVRGQAGGAVLFLPTHGSRGSNARFQEWQQASLAAEPS